MRQPTGRNARLHPEPRAYDQTASFFDPESRAHFEFAPVDTKYPLADTLAGERVLWMRCEKMRVPDISRPLFLFAVQGGDHEGFSNGLWCNLRMVYRPTRSATGFIIVKNMSATKPSSFV